MCVYIYIYIYTHTTVAPPRPCASSSSRSPWSWCPTHWPRTQAIFAVQTYLCIYTCRYIYIYIHIYIYVYVYVCVCIYIYIYIYRCTHCIGVGVCVYIYIYNICAFNILGSRFKIVPDSRLEATGFLAGALHPGRERRPGADLSPDGTC